MQQRPAPDDPDVVRVTHDGRYVDVVCLRREGRWQVVHPWAPGTYERFEDAVRAGMGEGE